MSRLTCMFGILVLLTVGVYSSVYHYGFVDYDDGDYITDNPHIKQGISVSDFKQAFTTYRVGNYAPLNSLSYCLDQSLFGLRPGPMHVENVMLHLLSGLLVWRLLFLCTGDLHRAFAVAALFLIHPMHVESVAWLAERKDVLSTPLLLLSMLAYLRYCQRGEWFSYLVMLSLFALSLMAKSMGVTLPAVLLLMDVWPLRRWPARNWKPLVVEKLPLGVLSIAASVMTGIAQRAAGATSSLKELSVSVRANNALVSYAIYIVKLVVPIKLAVFYQHPGSSIPVAAVIAATGLLLVSTFLFYRVRKTRPYLLFGWLWFLGTLVPVIGLVQVGGQSMADRYSYFPSIGLFIAAVWFFSDGLQGARVRGAMLAIVLAAFSITTWKQVSYWKDSRTLFNHAIAVTDDNPVAYLVLGKLDFQRGDMNAAFADYQRARKPIENARALDGLGNCVLQDHPERAVQYFRKAIEWDPHVAVFHADLAHALTVEQQWDEAKKEAQAALALGLDDAGVKQLVRTILDH